MDASELSGIMGEYIASKIDDSTLEDAVRECKFTNADQAKFFFHKAIGSTQNEKVAEVLRALNQPNEEIEKSIQHFQDQGYYKQKECLQVIFDIAIVG